MIGSFDRQLALARSTSIGLRFTLGCPWRLASASNNLIVLLHAFCQTKQLFVIVLSTIFVEFLQHVSSRPNSIVLDRFS